MSDMNCPNCGLATLPVRGGIAHLLENGMVSYPCPTSTVIPLIEDCRRKQIEHDKRIPVQLEIENPVHTAFINEFYTI